MACNGMTSSFFAPNFMLQMQTPHEEEHQLGSADAPGLLPAAAPCPNLQDFRGDQTARICEFPVIRIREGSGEQLELNLASGGAGMAPMMGKRSMSFSAIETCEEMNGEDELSDDGSQAGEKKRRLNVEQVRTLEKNFELGNKLEPERKMQLARALGLQPRQVAIWFQNRRARWKTKQLEKDYDVLKRQFEAIKSENEALHSQNKKLQSEILALKGRETSELINLNKETEGSCSNRSDNSSEINLDISRAPALDSPLHHPHHQQNLPFFQSMRPADIDQLLHSSSRPEVIQCPKVENGVPEGQFSNLLCSMEDQSTFWSWSDHHNFH